MPDPDPVRAAVCAARRPRLPRRPAPFWLIAAALAVTTALVVSRMLTAAAAGRDRYGELRSVVVARHHIEAGAPLRPGDTVRRRIPAALLPEGTVEEVPDGTVVVAELVAGEVVLAHRLAPAGLSPAVALLPRGSRGVSVPVDAASLPLRPGDEVDVLATVDTLGVASAYGGGTGEVGEVGEPGETVGADAVGGAPTVTVARRARVIVASDDAVTVAVTVTEAPRVAFALATGTVTLLLAGVDATG